MARSHNRYTYLPKRMPVGIQSSSGTSCSGGSWSPSASRSSAARSASSALPSSAVKPRLSQTLIRGIRGLRKTVRPVVCISARTEKGKRQVVRPKPPASSEKKESIINTVAMMTSDAVDVRS
eukprot:scaffold3497_cov153-Isochrysis_galbana.AAC.2